MTTWKNDRTGNNIFTIYTQNISGGRTKTQALNEALTKSEFHVIAIQETWFGVQISDIEIIKNTNYSIFRQDRSDTHHQKKGGGGVATIFKSNLKTKRHIFKELRIVQYICLEIHVTDQIIIYLNIYAPFGLSHASNVEIRKLLFKIEPIQKTDVIMIGDFNMPTVKWIQDPELPGMFLPLGGENEDLFISTIFDHDLKQIAPPPQGRNHLDLAFVSNENTSHCTYPIPEETIDRTSIRHAPIVINFLLHEESRDRIKFMNYGRMNLNKSKRDLDLCTFEQVSDDEALLEQWHVNLRATNKLSENIKKIQQIVVRNTPVKKIQQSWLSRHPWLRNSEAYNQSNNFKITAEKRYRKDASEVNRGIYKRACVVNSAIYENERTAFLNKVLDETKGNTKEFFSLMKSCTNMRGDTPETMLFEGSYVKGEEKLKAFAKQLGSCFKQDAPSLGNNFEEINE